jgi:NAD(P)-dependent dehydrogenase (short-subunit alcohol dehydrogenase family)
VRLQGAVCVVTGGAAGQGRAVATRYAAEGASVLILDVDSDGGREAAAEIRDQGNSAAFLQCDVSEETDWVQVRTYLKSKFGPASVLYNNAAVFLPEDRSVLEMEVATWDRVMAVNVRSIFLACKHIVPGMIERGGGSVINIASIRASLGTTVPQDAYAASKGAVVSLSRSLAAEFAQHNIRVNVISPGTILTEMAPIKDPIVAAERLKRYPLGRFGTTGDVEGAAVYLASEESAWTTGVELLVDGGTTSFYV